MLWLVFITALNAAYVSALPAPTVFFIANELLHLALGAALVVWLGYTWRRSPKAIPLLIAGLLGLYLMRFGATTDHRLILWAHIAFSIAGIAILVPKSRIYL